MRIQSRFVRCPHPKKLPKPRCVEAHLAILIGSVPTVIAGAAPLLAVGVQGQHYIPVLRAGKRHGETAPRQPHANFAAAAGPVGLGRRRLRRLAVAPCSLLRGLPGVINAHASRARNS
eukprot:6203490-Pleurochrysis_carterae.AAC.1